MENKDASKLLQGPRCPACNEIMKKVSTSSPGTATFRTMASGTSSSSDTGFMYSDMVTYVCTNPNCGRRLLIPE